jgi:hypothetical protein
MRFLSIEIWAGIKKSNCQAKGQIYERSSRRRRSEQYAYTDTHNDAVVIERKATFLSMGWKKRKGRILILFCFLI